MMLSIANLTAVFKRRRHSLPGSEAVCDWPCKAPEPLSGQSPLPVKPGHQVKKPLRSGWGAGLFSLLAYLTLHGLISINPVYAAQETLFLNQPVERELAKGESLYALELKAGQ